MDMALKVFLKGTACALIFFASLILALSAHANGLGEELKTLMANEDSIQANTPLSDVVHDVFHAERNIQQPDRTLTPTYNLFDAHFNVFDAKNSQIMRTNNLVDLDGKKQIVLFQGIQTYLNLVLQNKLVAISKNNVQLVEEIEKYIETEFQNKRIPQDDLTQARARLGQAQQTLTAYNGLLREAESRYSNLFKHLPRKTRLQEPFTPNEIIPETLEEALHIAYQNNPDLENASLLIDNKNEGNVQLASQTQDLSLRENAELVDLRYKELKLKEEVRIAFSDVETEERRLHTLQESESIAEDSFNLRHEMMQSGQETIIKVLDTALDLLNVRLALTSADFNHRLSLYQLLLATGQLNQNSISDLEGATHKEPNRQSDLQKAAIKPTQVPKESIALNVSASKNTTFTDAQAYDDLAAFESAHGAPYSDELAPEPRDEMTSRAYAQDEQAGYYLVLGSFTDSAYAKNFIVMAGMDNAFLKPANINGTTYQRVLVGPMNKDMAANSKSIARGRGIANSWVLHE